MRIHSSHGKPIIGAERQPTGLWSGHWRIGYSDRISLSDGVFDSHYPTYDAALNAAKREALQVLTSWGFKTPKAYETARIEFKVYLVTHIDRVRLCGPRKAYLLAERVMRWVESCIAPFGRPDCVWDSDSASGLVQAWGVCCE